MKKVGIIKRVLAVGLIFLLSINSFAAIVSDNDGSAFVTKAEFDALKASFNKQVDDYNASIDGKIDGAIANYLAGIKLADNVAVLISSAPVFTSSWTLPELKGSTYIQYGHFITYLRGLWNANEDTWGADYKLCHNSVAGDQAGELSYCTTGTKGNVLWVAEDFDDQISFNEALSNGLVPLSVRSNSYRATYYGAYQYRENNCFMNRVGGATITGVTSTKASDLGLTEFGSKLFDYTFRVSSSADTNFYIWNGNDTNPFKATMIVPAGEVHEVTVNTAAIFENTTTVVSAPCLNYLSGKKLPTDSIKVVSSTYNNKIDTAHPLVTWQTNTTGYNKPVSATDNYYGYGQLNFSTTLDKLINKTVSDLAGKTCYYYSGAPLFKAPKKGTVTVRLYLTNTGGSGSPTTLFAVSKNFSDVDITSETELVTLNYGGTDVNTITASKNATVTFSLIVEEGETYFIKAQPQSGTVSFDADATITD